MAQPPIYVLPARAPAARLYARSVSDAGAFDVLDVSDACAAFDAFDDFGTVDAADVFDAFDALDVSDACAAFDAFDVFGAVDAADVFDAFDACRAINRQAPPKTLEHQSDSKQSGPRNPPPGRPFGRAAATVVCTRSEWACALYALVPPPSA